MAKVELKQPVVDEISANIKDAQSVVLVDYRGLTADLPLSRIPSFVRICVRQVSLTRYTRTP